MLRSFLTGAASLALLLGAFASANAANNPPKIVYHGFEAEGYVLDKVIEVLPWQHIIVLKAN